MGHTVAELRTLADHPGIWCPPVLIDRLIATALQPDPVVRPTAEIIRYCSGVVHTLFFALERETSPIRKKELETCIAWYQSGVLIEELVPLGVAFN